MPFATINSRVIKTLSAALVALWLAGFSAAAAETNAASAIERRESPTARAERIFQETRTKFHAATNASELNWHFGQACFDWAEFATNATQRAEIAGQGIAACRALTQRQSNSAPAHYYLGMNLGQLARTKYLGALFIVDEMEREFKIVRTLDQNFDYAGPDRNLGLLYLEAPSIGSIGDKSKARTHLQRAAELASGFPENRLNLIEACLKWNDRVAARRILDALEASLPDARKEFSGPTWTPNWLDWRKRLVEARQQLGPPPKAIQSPRDKNNQGGRASARAATYPKAP